MTSQIAETELVVYYKGKPAILLNGDLIIKQECTASLELIKCKHVERLQAEEAMLLSEDPGELALLDSLCTLIEFELQALFGFKKDIKLHRFWLRPQCGCPQYDNELRYPGGYYIYDGSCLVHGTMKELK